MKYNKIVNKLIPADDLYWCEVEKRYTAISKKQLDEIISACVNQNITNLDEIYKIVNWANIINTGNILLKNFIYGNIKVAGFDKSDEPYFGVNE